MGFGGCECPGTCPGRLGVARWPMGRGFGLLQVLVVVHEATVGQDLALIGREVLEEEVEEQESAAGEVNAGLTEVRYRIRNNEDKCGRISGLWPEFESAGRLGAVCTRLYRLVRGNTGNGKITLEQYVQAAGKKVYLLDLVGTKPDELPVSLKNYLSIVASTKRNGVEIQKS